MEWTGQGTARSSDGKTSSVPDGDAAEILEAEAHHVGLGEEKGAASSTGGEAVERTRGVMQKIRETQSKHRVGEDLNV